MRKRRMGAKERRPDLAAFVFPSVLTAIASDFETYPLRDYTAGSPYCICCALEYFEDEVLAEIKEQYAAEIAAERKRLCAALPNNLAQKECDYRSSGR
jgi:hypothetical protein